MPLPPQPPPKHRKRPAPTSSPSDSSPIPFPSRDRKGAILPATNNATEHNRRVRFLRAANADFASLKKDPEAWNKVLRERELWKHTLADGLAWK
jgi:hypothetical protein